ncbi:beta-hexosaminidase-like [Littorina saxatilis]|uniref:beta-hexosaminidase-like n=1 Tax=Littorina saxatilis TaxID=31220 RepID=UPI0038B5C96B
MPGHSRAAIKAMALRRRLKTEAGDMQGAHEYELDEMGDPSEYSSVQLFNDDAVNPCMDSSYRFIRHVMRGVKQMHAGVNPLNIYHFGGDEVAEGAWIHSKACSEHVKNGTDLKLMFSTRVGALAAEEGLDLAAWEDGIMDKGQPIPRDEMKPRDVYANAWQNVWEWGAASRAHVLANEGYKVIMSQATHLYFDHPYEPDPEERGFYWATRATDNRKVFLFQPQHLWNNIAITRLGDPYTLKDVCGKDNAGCPDLKLKDNIVGMQGHLWAETVRTGEQLEYMIFPRLLALAERAWHASPWEGKEGGASAEKLDDWTSFANALGYGQLSVLDGLNISYRVCPPGVKQEGSQLITNTEFPGLMTQYLTSGFDRWQDVTNQRVNVRHGQTVHVRTLSADGQRSSAPVTMKVSINQVNTDRPSSSAPSLLLRGSSLLLLCVLLAALRVLN